MSYLEFTSEHPLLFLGALVAIYALLGFLLTSWLRDNRIWVILAALILGLASMWPPREKLKLGIDLQGGTILVYQVDTERVRGGFTQMEQLVAALSKRINPAGVMDVTIRPMAGDRVEIILPAAEPQEVQAIQDRITQMGQLEFRILATDRHDASAIRQAREKLRNKERQTAPTGYEWLPIDSPDSVGADDPTMDGYVLTRVPEESMAVTGEELKRAFPTEDDKLRPAVGFQFDPSGTRKFARLTRKYQPLPDGFQYKLAIVLDRRVMSAPVILEPMESGNGQITGGRDGFTTEEVNNHVAVLNAGQLPAMLIPTPISKDTVTATLGEDTIRKGEIAIGIAMIVVPIFMIGYYLFSGGVAVFALVLNLILILGFMGFSQSTFTLPGLAGLALTIGMAVDANVLIFERMREERERGSSLTQAIRNGFDRAWMAIFDSNLTTIFTGFILYWLGTDQVKGFALTLIAGLVINLFTAVFVSRTIFDVCAKQGWLTELRMLHMIKTPTIDYVSKRYYFMAGSAVVIVLGLAVSVARGSTLFDIDFTGGTAISLRLTDPELGSDFVRNEAGKVLPNVKVERLIQETDDNRQESLFLIRTTETQQDEVRKAVVQHFHDTLGVLATVKIADWQPVAAAPSDSQSPSETQAPNENQPAEPTKEPTPPADSEKKQESTEPDKSVSNDGDEDEQDEAAQTEDAKTQTPPQDSNKAKTAETENVAADKSQATPSDAPTANADSDSQRVRIKLNREITQDALASKINQALVSMGLQQPEVHYTLESEAAVFGPSDTFILETKQDVDALRPKLSQLLEADPVFEREHNFKSQVAGETRLKALWALVLSWAMMVVYLALRFKNPSYGFAAVVALVHDVLIALAAVAVGGWLGANFPTFASLLLIEDFKIDLTIVTAFMTIIGFSVNDTIVIFDRIREIRGKSPYVTGEMINASVNQCMSRTILTAATVIAVVFIMYVWGGPGIHGFAWAMLIGCLSGTYSTIFIAAPILILFAGQQRKVSGAKSVTYSGAPARA